MFLVREKIIVCVTMSFILLTSFLAANLKINLTKNPSCSIFRLGNGRGDLKMRWILVDKILEMNPGVSAKGVRAFSAAEIFFMDHFPGFPIVPGVLQIEMIAQVGGRCIRAANTEILTVLASVQNVRFRKNITPGDQAIIYAEVTAIRSGYSSAKGRIEVDGELVCEAEIRYGHVQIPEKMRNAAHAVNMGLPGASSSPQHEVRQ